MIRLWQKDKLLPFIPSPTRRNRDPIFLVNRMAKFAGIERLRWRKGIHVLVGLIHFAPLATTFNHFLTRRSIKKLMPVCSLLPHP
jgi:hypothetical protein